jgi:hypothetical protein
MAITPACSGAKLMLTAYDHFLQIVDRATPPEMRTLAMRGFAEQLDWTPSYEFKASLGVDAASDHLEQIHLTPAHSQRLGSS